MWNAVLAAETILRVGWAGSLHSVARVAVDIPSFMILERVARRFGSCKAAFRARTRWKRLRCVSDRWSASTVWRLRAGVHAVLVSCAVERAIILLSCVMLLAVFATVEIDLSLFSAIDLRSKVTDIQLRNFY